jgi:hypothetical protein
MAQRMPNPTAVPIVGPGGKLTEPWIRWLTEFIAEVTSASTTVNTPAPPAPTPPAPVPAPDPGPATEDLIEGIDLRVAGLEQLPAPHSHADLRAAVQALMLDPTPSTLAARIARCERAINDILQGTTP